MHILTPEDVKDDTSRQEGERRTRIRNESTEEARLIRSINDLREIERKEKERIHRELTETEAQRAVRKTVLQQEVESLEARKAEALKPAREIEERARDLLEGNQREAARLEDREDALDARSEDLTSGFEKLADREQVLDERERSLDGREAGIAAAEGEIKRSSTALGQKWVEYHNSVAELNERIGSVEKREVAAATAERANAIAREEMERDKKRVAEADRAVRDKYAALEEAKKHLKIP